MIKVDLFKLQSVGQPYIKAGVLGCHAFLMVPMMFLGEKEFKDMPIPLIRDIEFVSDNNFMNNIVIDINGEKSFVDIEFKQAKCYERLGKRVEDFVSFWSEKCDEFKNQIVTKSYRERPVINNYNTTQVEEKADNRNILIIIAILLVSILLIILFK